jgi:hypothetical protein
MGPAHHEVLGATAAERRRQAGRDALFDCGRRRIAADPD